MVPARALACWWPCGQPIWTKSGTSSSSPTTPTTHSLSTRSPCPRLCWRSTVRLLDSSSIRSVQPACLLLALITQEAWSDQPLQPYVQAVGIIEAVLEKFGTYEHFEAATGGQLLTKCQIWSIVRKYMQKEGCVGEVSKPCLRGPSSVCPKPGCQAQLHTWPARDPRQAPVPVPIRWELALSKGGEGWVPWPTVWPGCPVASVGPPASWSQGWWPWLRFSTTYRLWCS